MISRDAADEILSRHGLRTAGAPLTRAKAVVVAIHGRGADAASILSLADVLAQPDIAFLAPEAAGPRLVSPELYRGDRGKRALALKARWAQIEAILDDLSAAGVADGQDGFDRLQPGRMPRA